MSHKKLESRPHNPGLDQIVDAVRELPQGLSGSSPKDMVEYADPDSIWEELSDEAQRIDDNTGVLDGITNKINKYLRRTGESPSEELNRQIADKVSMIAELLDIDSGEKPSKTERIAIEKLVLNFSENEAADYLGDGFTAQLQAEAQSSDEIKNAVPTYFSRWERLRRVASDRNAPESSIQSVRAATAIAKDKESYLRAVGVPQTTDRLVSALSSYNILTLTTINPESYDTVLVSACRAFARAEEQFPELTRQMPEEVMTIILRRGGSGKKQVVDEEKLFAYLARKDAALTRSGNKYVVRTVGGSTPEEAASRAGAVVAHGSIVQSNGRRGTIAKRLRVGDFRATEYGDDFSETLVTVADKLPREQLLPLLDRVERIRRLGETFAGQFDEFDDSIKTEVKRAIGERVTEALYVARHLAETNGEVSARVLGNRITVESMDEVMDALELIDIGLTRIVEAEQSGVVAKSYDEDNRSAWHLGLESDVLVQVKPHGERRGEHKRGVEHSEEAQINYSVDVTSSDGEYVPISIANYRRRHALSIRLDLEGILRDANGGKVGFDATRDQLTAALDLGSLRGSRDNPNVRVARVVSLGNKLRKRELQQGKSLGYHTSLPAEYGHKTQFAELAEFKRDEYRRRQLGRGAVVAVLDRPSHRSSVSRSGKAAA